MASQFKIKRGSTYRSLHMVLSLNAEPDDPYEPFTTARVFMQPSVGGPNKIDGKSAVLEAADDPNNILVRYDFDPADVNEIGKFSGYVVCADADGREDRFPAEGYFSISITKNFEP
jgi:hypothetical protein